MKQRQVLLANPHPPLRGNADKILVDMRQYGQQRSPQCEMKKNWAASWQNQQSDYAPSEDSDQPGHLEINHIHYLILKLGHVFVQFKFDRDRTYLKINDRFACHTHSQLTMKSIYLPLLRLNAMLVRSRTKSGQKTRPKMETQIGTLPSSPIFYLYHRGLNR